MEPRDVGLVEALAEAAPTAFFDSYVSGSVYEERIGHSAELIKGKLYLTYVVEEAGYDDNDEEDEESGSVERSVYDPITKEYHQREASTPSLWGRVFVILDQVNKFQNASKLTAYIESLGGKVDKEYICIDRKGHKHVRWMLPCRTIHWLDKSIVAKCMHTVDGCIVGKNCKENYKYESAN